MIVGKGFVYRTFEGSPPRWQCVSCAAAGLGEKHRVTICIGDNSPISMAANLGIILLVTFLG
jgi:hypothetical protein